METGKTLTSETLMVCAGMCTKVHIKRVRWKWKIGQSTEDNKQKQHQGKKKGEGKMEMGVGKKDSKTHKDVVILLWIFLGPK
jgi:hypothetical protein